jgi:hypothetical protein
MRTCLAFYAGLIALGAIWWLTHFVVKWAVLEVGNTVAGIAFGLVMAGSMIWNRIDSGHFW